MRRGAAAWLVVIAGLVIAGVVAAATGTSDTDRTRVSAEGDSASTDEVAPGDTVAQSGAAGLDGSGDATQTTAAALTGPIEGRVLLVGGSTAAAFNWNPTTRRALTGAEFTLDAESCRRLYNPSCAALRSSPPTTAYEVIQAKGDGHHTMILFGGYNDSGVNFRDGFEKVVEAARAKGIVRIMWLDYHDDSDKGIPEDPLTATNYRGNNAILDELMATGDYPDVQIAHWSTFSRGQRHWFTDTVHFTAAGSWAAADYLSRKLAFLDNRACPMPREPGEQPQNPCPDPDLGPPDVDYPAVYGFDPGNLWCYPATGPDHIECRPKKTVEEAGTKVVTETLTYGSAGPQVETLQFKLRDIGLYETYPTGKYENYTVMAIMKFQQREGLKVTGAAGPRTREALGLMCPGVKRADDGHCPQGASKVVFPWEMGAGDEGIRVYVIQLRLKELELLDREPNSTFDDATVEAVKHFQKLKRLPQTGTVDARTATKLGFFVPDPTDTPSDSTVATTDA